ncbi:MAG: arginine deiminase-related protein [Vampirovibrionales bacterium]|nr:arginine deiminase-related protein [Vampirovibrionales bacterium]
MTTTASTAVRKPIELTGHLFDSLTVSKALDTIESLGGDFELKAIDIGHSKKAFSNLKLDVIAPDEITLRNIIEALEPYVAKVPVVFEQVGSVEVKTSQTKYPLGKDDAHPSILMSPPDYFEVAYAINPWMQGVAPVDVELAKKQWQDLYNAIENAGAKMYTLPPVKGLPDLVFTANCAFVYGDQAVTAHYRHAERQGEEPYGQQWFKDHGYQVTALPDHVHFEGSGDALIWKDRVFSGYKMRSDIAAHGFLSNASGLPILSLELNDPKFYHVDVCFCPLTGDYLIWYPEAFDEYGRSVIEANVPADKRIAVTTDEANQFVCNAVSVGKTVIFNEAPEKPLTRVKGELEARGFSVVTVNMSEFLKAGGSAKCLTVRLDH